MYKVPPAVDNAKSAVTEMEEAVKNLTNQFGTATSNIEDYNKYIDELNDKNVLSATSVKDIMEKHKELIAYLGNEGELRKKLAELIQAEEDVQQNAYVGMLEMSEEFYAQKVKGSGLLEQKLGEYYKSDFENYKSLAEMKSVVDSNLIKDLSDKWGDYFSLSADGMLQVDSSIYEGMTGEDGVMNRATVALNRQITNTRSKLEDVAKRFKSITLSIAPINFDKINLSKNTTGKNGSGSESTTYESKLDGMDKFTAYLDDINTQLQKQDDLISDISDKAKLYKDAGDRKSLLEALKLETEQYTEQARKLATLKQDAGLVSTQQAVLAQTFKKTWGAMSGADLSTWTRTDFNKMFEQLFPTKTFKNKSQQEAYENQKKYFSTLVDDWFKYADQVKSINNDILSTQNDMLQLMQDRYDTYFKVIEGNLKAVTSSIDNIKNSMDMLTENEEFDKREEYAQQLIAKTTTYRDTIEQTITVLTSHRDTLQQGSAEWTIVNDQIKNYEKTLQDANKDLKDASDLIAQIQQQELDTASNLQDKIVDALRNKYNKAKEVELDAVEKKKQADLDKANAELEQLKKELADLQDETQSKKDQLAKEKAELELWKKDNSAYAQGKVKELEASIKQHEKELAIDAKQKEIDDKQKEIDTINDTADKEEKRIEDHYKTLLDDQALYAETLKIMETQSQDEILELLKSYDEKYSQLGTTLGKAYADALMAEIKKGQDALKAMQDGVAPVVTPDKPTETPAPPTTPTTPPPIAPPATPPAPPSAPTSTASIAWDGHYYQKGSYGDVVKRIQQNLNAIGYNLVVDGAFGTNTRNAIVDFQRKNGLSADGIVGSNTWGKLIKFDTGGYTGDWGGSGRLAVLHEKERVLNQSQTRAFEYLIYDILPKFYNQTAMSKLDNIASIIFNEPVIKNEIRITNNTPFDVDNNMDNLNKAIKQELKQAGFRINLVR
jgi:peptidoglycan hydrolase-like protein with peptidoglycan-binding domain/DNA repair exonuclease SbcCD ATPase subunit